MECTDHELIRRTLSGDQESFTHLVKRYQERVHALAWRKTDDFHVAEEITQDTFLRAYKHLRKLKNPNLFAGWLYVIANRLCDTWLKERSPDIESLDNLPTVALEEQRYAEYLEKQLEERASEKRVDLVKRLLQKLPESERIVITLHYLAGSSVKEISDFLGVSLNTVKSRLYRARQRLQKEEHMVSETLGSIQPPITLTENIMRTIKDTEMQIDPTTPSGSKPFIPWVVATSTFVLVMMMLGLGAQHSARFQQPYSLDTSTELTVDIVDASVMASLPSDPDVKNQIGHADAPNESEGTIQEPNAESSFSASGHVIDDSGNPVSDVKLAIIPVEYNNGGWRPIPVDDGQGWPDAPLAFPAEVNSNGDFTIKAINQGPYTFGVLPYYEPTAQVLKLKIGDISFYSIDYKISSGIVFAPESIEKIENIEVKVTHFLRIQGTVLHMDKTPVADARIKFNVNQLYLDGMGESNSGFGTRTDFEGNFIQYVPSYGPAFYILSVNYQGQRAILKPIVVKPGDRTHNAVFTLNSPLLPPSPRDVLNRLQAGASVYSGLDAQDVWVVNPLNGHAYKKIRCSSPEDAILQSTEEGAYLVRINDEAEQEWIKKVFLQDRILIGLNDIEEEGVWKWHNGESVEYTNWAEDEPDDSDNGDEDYVILTLQGWKDIGPESIEWRWVQTTLLEKENWSDEE